MNNKILYESFDYGGVRGLSSEDVLDGYVNSPNNWFYWYLFTNLLHFGSKKELDDTIMEQGWNRLDKKELKRMLADYFHEEAIEEIEKLIEERAYRQQEFEELMQYLRFNKKYSDSIKDYWNEENKKRAEEKKEELEEDGYEAVVFETGSNKGGWRVPAWCVVAAKPSDETKVLFVGVKDNVVKMYVDDMKKLLPGCDSKTFVFNENEDAYNGTDSVTIQHAWIDLLRSKVGLQESRLRRGRLIKESMSSIETWLNDNGYDFVTIKDGRTYVFLGNRGYEFQIVFYPEGRYIQSYCITPEYEIIDENLWISEDELKRYLKSLESSFDPNLQ